MTKRRALLDCTLRDGGYVNDWAFGRENIAYLFEREVNSGVEMIEVGFLDERCPFDPDRTILPDTASFDRVFGTLPKKNAMAVAMIDYGTCGIERLAPADKTCLDGIRVIFKKDKREAAIDFCREVQALGYQVFVQAVSITDYAPDELLDLIRLVNDLQPFAVSMVDTYGLLNDEGLLSILKVFDEHLADGIAIGYHAHNNFQLGFANAAAALKYGTDREILVDGSLYGMGKSAGNAPIELIAMYMNEHCGKRYDVLQMQEAISTAIMDIYEKTPWGYKLFFYIAASNHCHPDYVAFLMNKRTLSVSAINEILSRIPEPEKLKKNMKLIESLYLSYQTNECNDETARAALKDLFSGREVLLLGPGESLKKEEERILAFAKEKQPLVVSVNHLYPGVPSSWLFLTNSRRYNQMARKLSEERGVQVIATSNVTRAGGRFDCVLNYDSLIDHAAEFPDNSLLMALKTLSAAGVRTVYLAGFDGYTPYDLNLYDGKMAYSFVREKAETLNDQVRTFLRDRTDLPKIVFLTKSQYEEQT